MKIDSRAVLLLPLLLGASTVSDELYYHPEAELGLSRTFSIEAEAKLASVDLAQFGEPIDPADMGDAFGVEALDGSVTATGTYSDDMVRSQRGRVLELVREFGEFTTDGEVDEDDENAPKRARFVWNEEKESYDIELLEPAEPTADQLERAANLRVDVDHVHLLPAGPVEVGDTWEADMDLDALMAAVMPLELGRAALEKAAAEASEEGDEGDKIMAAIFEALGESLDETKAKLTYQGIKADETSGRQVALSSIAFETEFEMDLGTMLADLIAASSRDGERMPEATVELVLTAKLGGEGEFAWDVEGHHLVHLTLPLEFELGLEGRMAFELFEGEELEFIAGSIAWDGTLVLEQHTVRD